MDGEKNGDKSIEKKRAVGEKAGICALLIYHSPSAPPDPPPHLINEAQRRLRDIFPSAALFSNRQEQGAIWIEESRQKDRGVGAGQEDRGVGAAAVAKKVAGTVAGAAAAEVAGAAGEGATLPYCLYRALELEGEVGNPDQYVGLCYGWYPLLERELSLAALSDHTRYIAHFTYGENIPIGLLPDFASGDFIETLWDEVSSNPSPEAPGSAGREPFDLRSFVFQRIDRYDVEIFYRRPDLRQYRLDFSTESSRSIRLVTDLLHLKPQLQYGDLEDTLKAHPQILRPYPSYFEIELTRKSPLQPFYWPTAPKEQAGSPDASLNPQLIQKLISDLSRSDMAGDATIALGGLGEPMEHPLFFETVERLLQLKQTARVYIETFGLKLQGEDLRRLASMPDRGKLHIIIRLSTLQPQRYQEMYGHGLLEHLLRSIQAITETIANSKHSRPAFHVYAEMLRIQENDDEVEGYMDYFSKLPIEPLLQKYNRYIDLLPERRVADLTPLHRDFCWHLSRDLYLTADGLVPLCKQDPFAQRAKAIDFRRHSIQEIYSQTAGHHSASLRGRHENLPMPCLQCDEWYTFNG